MPAAIILASVNFATPAISSVKVPHSLNSTAIQNEDPGDTSLEEDGSGNGEAANELGVPQNIRVETTLNSLTVNWDAANNATSYQVCFRTNGHAKKCWKQTPKLRTTTFTLTRLKPTGGGDYYVTVSALRDKEVKSATPVRADLQIGQMTSPKITSDNFEKVSLAWARPTNANNFQVEIFTDPVSIEPAHTISTSRTSITTYLLLPETTYFIRIRPFNSDISGEPSDFTTITTDPNPKVQLTVMSFNLCGNDQCIDKTDRKNNPDQYLHFPTWNNRAVMIKDYLNGIKPDIVATQENPGRLSLTGYAAAHYYSGKYLIYKSAKFTKLRSGVITMPKGTKPLSDYPSIPNNIRNCPDSSATVYPSTSNKYAVWAELKDRKTGIRFIVVDPHLESRKCKFYDDIRNQQMSKLTSDLKKINSANLPTVIAGDFNSNSSNANQKYYPGGYDAPKKLLTDHGYLNSLDEASKAGKAENMKFNTANQSGASWNVVSAQFLKNSHHVDAIWVSKYVKALAWKQHVRLNEQSSAYKSPYISDHNPIEATLQIEYQPKRR